jgi:hypothetical protein
MRKIAVFLFRYRASDGKIVLSEDYATAKAIAEIGGSIEPGTMMLVEAAEVSVTSGLVTKKKDSA